jgi:hypothetical protein
VVGTGALLALGIPRLRRTEASVEELVLERA